jgi:hypothetical protein
METTVNCMNGCKLHHVVAIVLLFATFLYPQTSVDAQEQNFVEIPLEAFHDEQSIELLGLISSQTLNISIPRGWLLGEENWLEIKFRKSDLLDLVGSSVTISLNGSHVSSHRLTQLSETKQQILVPANMFTQGNNTLTFTGTLYLPDDRNELRVG